MENAVGYCAIIFPETGKFQGLYIIDSPQVQKASVILNTHVEQVMKEAGEEFGLAPEGILQATAAAALEEGNQMILAGAIRLLKDMYGPYFIVYATPEPEGTRTSMDIIEVDSIDDARAVILSHPAIRENPARAATIH